MRTTADADRKALAVVLGYDTQVAGQKLVDDVSMLHIGFLTDYVRRRA